MTAMIEVKHLFKTFTTEGGELEALHDVNLSVDSGDIYGIIGMSGAGKSTLVRCLNFLERPTKGEVYIGGNDLSALGEKELRSERSRIAMIFQHFNLLMQKNVLDNVALPLIFSGAKKKEAGKKALQMLDTVGLSDKKDEYPTRLSGGQKQRVAIARALVTDPKILLSDEATSALDPQTTASILELLERINREMGITIVMITHQMAVIREICNHVAIVEAGRIVEEGRVEDIFSHPKSRAARMLVIGSEGERREAKAHAPRELLEDRKIRIVFSDNSAFEPVIANMVLQVGTPVNILKADTKNVGGVAKGEMILGLPKDKAVQEEILAYLKERGVDTMEVSEDVYE